MLSRSRRRRRNRHPVVYRAFPLAGYTLAGCLALVGVLPPWRPGILLSALILALCAYSLWSVLERAAGISLLLLLIDYGLIPERDAHLVGAVCVIGLMLFGLLLLLFSAIVGLLWLVNAVGDLYYETRYQALKRRWQHSLAEFAQSTKELAHFEGKYHMRQARRGR
jgi:hypothetical protein